METSKAGWKKTKVNNLVRNGQSRVYYARLQVGGKDKWKSLKTKVLEVAERKLEEFKKQMGAQEMEVDGPLSGKTVAADFIAAYLETMKGSTLSDGSKSRLESAVKALVKTWPELPGLDVRNVSKKACREWADKARRIGTGFIAPKAKTVRVGMSGSAFNKCLEVLRAIFAIAVEAGVVAVNPALSVGRATVASKKIVPLSREKFDAIVVSVSQAGARQSKDCADMVRLLAYSGTRLAEATALRWSDVDEERKVVHINGTKTASSDRTIPLFPTLAQLFAEMHARRPREAKDAPILLVHECKGALTRACNEQGVKRMTHHDLRHQFASRCIEFGVDIPTISRWLGHKDGGVLAMRVYGHLSQEHSQAQAAKIIF